MTYVKYFSLQSIRLSSCGAFLATKDLCSSPANRRCPTLVGLGANTVSSCQLVQPADGPYFNNPNTPTPLVVPTNTFPLAIIGVMYLFPLPK